DKDITNLEVTVPFLALVSGTITVEGGTSPAPWLIEARSSNRTLQVSISPASSNGSFTLRLSEGSHQIFVRTPPSGYVIKSITAGDLDLTKSSLNVSPDKPIEEVRIVIGRSPVESIAVATVSGKISGLTDDNLLTARVTLSPNNSGGFAIETRLDADGTFEFSNVPTGLYNVRLAGSLAWAMTPTNAQVFVQG